MKIQVTERSQAERASLPAVLLPEGAALKLDSEVGQTAAALLKKKEWAPKFRESLLLYGAGGKERLLLVGLGPEKELDPERLRRAAGVALGRAKGAKVSSLGITLLSGKVRPEEAGPTIASNLRSGEPVWIGYGRSEADVKRFLDTLTAEKKSKIKLFACDMHKPFHAAIRSDEQLAHAAIVHDPFHIMKRAGEAVTELRRQIFFRAGPELRAIGRGTRWLVLRPWERLGEEDQIKLNKLFALNNKLMRAYQVLEELREALKAPDGATMRKALQHILYRTEKKSNVPMRKLHDSLRGHYDGIVALAEHRPPTGRLEALNNNWETLVRRGRGYRDHQYLFRKLQFITANPVRTAQGADRFLALGLAAPTSAAA